MIQTISTKILIIGAGFCGRAVASTLDPSDYIIIDCGEPFSYESVLSSKTPPWNPPIVGKIPSFRMGFMDANWQSYILGGNSNWWGGWASRISDKILSGWIDPNDIKPFYVKAERLLNAHGDVIHNPDLVGEIPGAKFWKEWALDFFEKSHITPETKNFTRDDKGKCLGRGTCRACPENAKTMPSDIKIENLAYSTKLISLNYKDSKATVQDEEGLYDIEFEQVVIASGGFENVKIVKSFNSDAGKFFQDHTSASLLVKFDKTIPYRKIGAESHLEIEDLCIIHNDIEIKTLLLTAEPSIELLSISDIDPDIERDTFGQIWLQIEIPPSWNLEMKTRDNKFYVDYTSYIRNLQLIDEAVEVISSKLSQKGLQVCAKNLNYRMDYGGFHLSGTTMIGKIVDNDCKIIGTDNVYVSGASVIPRAGGSGPSLTAVALAIKLGEHLKNKLRNEN